jgi:hypothetical protein
MLTWMREFDGYRGLMILGDGDSGRAFIVSLWDSRESADRSARGRAEVRESMVAAAGAELESVELMELVFEDRPDGDATED